MTPPLGAILLAIACALIAALAASRYIEANGRSRLALAQVDFVSFLASAGGVLSLVPEILNAFAPEMLAGPMMASGFQNLDYAAYVLVPIGIGMGLARRWISMRIEQRAPAGLPAGQSGSA